jgi:uncharacterized coiled-coil DUF342 family protein
MGKQKSKATRVAEAAGNIRDKLEEATMVKDEYESWRDGLEGTNLESAPIYEQLTETIDAMDNAIAEIESGLDELDGIEFPVPFRG